MPIGYDTSGHIANQSIPVIGHRIVNNTSVVMDGKTLVIGGLLDNKKTLVTTAPPVLGDIPGLGFLFSKTSEVTEQTELIIYIAPTVITNDQQLKNLTKSEVNKLRNYDPKTKGTIDQMLLGKKTKTDDIFNLFDYFADGNYREKQNLVPQPGNLLGSN